MELQSRTTTTNLESVQSLTAQEVWKHEKALLNKENKKAMDREMELHIDLETMYKHVMVEYVEKYTQEEGQAVKIDEVTHALKAQVKEPREQKRPPMPLEEKQCHVEAKKTLTHFTEIQ